MADNNFYFSVYSGEQIEKALGMFLNGGLEDAVERAEESAESAAQAQEAVSEIAADIMSKGVFVGDENTDVWTYYEAYNTKRPCFMLRAEPLAGGETINNLWVLVRAYGGGDANSGYADFYRITEEGVIQCGKLDGFNVFTVTNGDEKTFVGNAYTTADEYLAAINDGKPCFMLRSDEDGNNVMWVLCNVIRIGGEYKACFYRITNDGTIECGTMDNYGEFITTTVTGGGGDVDISGKADASTTTTAGTYGSALSSGGIYVPTFTVNEQGIVTGASESLIPMASAKSNGLMAYLMHSYVSKNGHLEIAYMDRDESYADTEIDLSVPNCKMKNPYVGGTARYMPSVYGVYAYNADDDSFISVPIIKTKGTSGGTGTVYVNFDRAYLDSSGSATFVVLYERIYSTYGSSM